MPAETFEGLDLALPFQADVAQPVEQRFRKPPVGSSSLPVGSEIPKDLEEMARPAEAGHGGSAFSGATVVSAGAGVWATFSTHETMTK